MSIPLDLDRDEDLPRAFCRVGSAVLAYGGDDGTILRIPSNQPFRRMDDDAIRSVALVGASSLAIGYESGSSEVLEYASVEDMLSSSSKDAAFSQQAHNELRSIAGPCFDAPVRDFASWDNYLAVASESGVCIVAFDTRRLWESPADLQGSGVRSVAVSSQGHVLALLTMKGLVCLYDVKDPTSVSLMHSSHCVAKEDVGELLGADVWDRSLRLVWLNERTLLIPGQAWLQIWTIDGGKVQEWTVEGTPHVEPIVAIAVGPNGCFCTTDREGRVVSWQLQEVSRSGWCGWVVACQDGLFVVGMLVLKSVHSHQAFPDFRFRHGCRSNPSRQARCSSDGRSLDR